MRPAVFRFVPFRDLTVLCMFLLVFFAFPGLAYAQQKHDAHADATVALEDSLHRMAMAIIEPAGDEERLERNEVFKEVLREALLRDSTLAQSFSLVRTVSFLVAPRGEFRLVTWYVPLSGGQVRYFGFVQTPPGRSEPATFFELDDKTAVLAQVAGRELECDEWFGAYYYELVHQRYRRNDYFALLGWKGDNPATRKRVIEPFRITHDGPVFGAQVFDAGDRKPYRIIFEYSARVSMSLKYHPDFPAGRRKTTPMIVFDRLSPTDESLRGNYRFYVPEVNVFDGFEFKNGRWVFVPDVDARVTIDPSLQPLNPPQNP